MEQTTKLAVDAIPLMTAAAKAKLSYLAFTNCMLRGEVVGWQAANGRWLIDPASLDRFLQKRAARRAAQTSEGGAT